jgi:hypothetical protein
MKIHVVTDEKGNIVATIHGTPGERGDTPAGKPVALAGQKIQEIDLPKELEGLTNAEQLHKRLKEHLR